MIEFKINDKKYSLEWMYEGSNITSKLAKKWIQPQIKTTCFLKDENHNILATGYTIKHKTDNNCKEIGRKYSLKKMLSNYDEIAGLGYEFRKAVWEAYHSRKAKPLLTKENIEGAIWLLEQVRENNECITEIYFEYAR